MGSQYRGLYCQDSSPFIENSSFSANATAIQNGTTCYLTIQNSNIYGNSSHGINNANTTYTLLAANNWWGQTSGPTHASNPGGTGDRVSDQVTFSPFAAAVFAPLPQFAANLPVSTQPDQCLGHHLDQYHLDIGEQPLPGDKRRDSERGRLFDHRTGRGSQILRR